MCSYLSDKARLTFYSSSKPCTVMSLVSCPLVCLFSHVPIYHKWFKKSLDEHKLEQFTAINDIFFFNVSTIRSMHPSSMRHSVSTNTSQAHCSVHADCFESHTWHVKRWTLIHCAQCFFNNLLFILLIIVHKVLGCFCETRMSFKTGKRRNETMMPNKNSGWDSSLTACFRCPFAFSIFVSLQCNRYLFSQLMTDDVCC